jgi:ketosteroid isomerase-like protein
MSDFDATESEATKANAALIRSGYEAFARGDVAGALAVFADDILWHVPGRGPLSGDDRGHAQVLEFFGHFMRLSAHSGFSSMRFWQGGTGSSCCARRAPSAVAATGHRRKSTSGP